MISLFPKHWSGINEMLRYTVEVQIGLEFCLSFYFQNVFGFCFVLYFVELFAVSGF
jgi:hypothetical protein